MYVIGIDVGTSGTKTVLFDTKGSVISSHTSEYPMYQPKNGWAEQNPEDWWKATVEGLRAVTANVSGGEILGIGLSGQMHGLCMLDEKGDVLRNSIIWCDQRTGEECADIERIVGREKLISITANPALTGFTASKIMWVKKHEPEIYAKCAHILLPKDFIRYKLTGEFATEVSDASGMQLLDVPNRCWSDEVISLLGIDKALLPKVYESPEITGKITSEVSDITGVPAGVLVVGGAGDNAAAAIGTGTVRNGCAFTTIGTSGVVYLHSDKVKIDPLGRVHTFCCAVPGEWHMMGVTQSAGLSLRWLRDTFCGDEKREAESAGVDTYDIMSGLAAKSPAGANRLLFLPYLMGERTPHLDPNARGSFIGISPIHTKGDFIRAVMEGVGFSLKDCLSVFKEMNVEADKMLLCGGGARGALWRGIISDIYNTPVYLTESSEGAALGAAILAMVGAGVYGSVPEACDEIINVKSGANPSSDSVFYERYYEIYKKLYSSLKGDFAALSTIEE